MKIGLFGCGAYGMALSNILIDNRCEVTMWTKFVEEKQLLEEKRGNDKLIPNFKIADSIKITTSIEECVKDKDLLIIAIPAAFVNDLCVSLKPYIKDNHILVATKGIEQKTGLFMNQIIEKHLDTKNVAIISGGTFAIDLTERMPAGLSLATLSSKTAEISKKALQNNYVKLRVTDDIIGVEICGSLKNVIALSSGIIEGLGANESTKAMLITESVHDMEEILNSFECKRRTVLSYAGIGDLILTCNSTKSRNYSFGKLIGSKASKEEIKNYLENTTVEGYYTLTSIYELLKDKNVKIPTIDLIYDIVVNGRNPEILFNFLINKL